MNWTVGNVLCLVFLGAMSTILTSACRSTRPDIAQAELGGDVVAAWSAAEGWGACTGAAAEKYAVNDSEPGEACW